MKVGTQHGSSDDILAVLAALGVHNICAALPSERLDDKWSVESLLKLRDRVESFGIRLDMLPLPMSSHPIAQAEHPAILLGKAPERDREIDDICRMIRNTARAGIPALKYNLTLIGVVRTDPTVAAEEHKVRLCCHPQDPGMPPGKGYRGVETVLGSVAGLKRFVSIRESAYHGLNFCQGTVSEMLEDPRREIGDVIRYFGERGKIFNVHFRNIQGHFLDFRETFIDDGDVDMLAALRVYRDVGFDGMMMPDHVPTIAGDEGGRQAFAFTFGYIRALIKALEAESA
jgi:mannonate dehydratase